MEVYIKTHLRQLQKDVDFHEKNISTSSDISLMGPFILLDIMPYWATSIMGFDQWGLTNTCHGVFNNGVLLFII